MRLLVTRWITRARPAALRADAMHPPPKHTHTHLPPRLFAGAALERRLGTLRFSASLLAAALAAGAVDVAAGAALGLPSLGTARLYPAAWYQCAVGFSGVIFAAISMEVATSQSTTRSVMGWFSVPSWAYPWALLLLYSLLIPQVSFFGHLSGLLAGWLIARGWLDPVLPSEGAVARLEGSNGGTPWALCAPCVRLPNYVLTARGTGSGFGGSGGGESMLLPRWVRDCGGSGGSGAGGSSSLGTMLRFSGDSTPSIPSGGRTTGDAATSADRLGGGGVTALAGRAAELRAQAAADRGRVKMSAASPPAAGVPVSVPGKEHDAVASGPSKPSAVRALEAMGFASDAAAHALEAAGGDVGRAAGILADRT